jgi:hypothetical protein
MSGNNGLKIPHRGSDPVNATPEERSPERPKSNNPVDKYMARSLAEERYFVEQREAGRPSFG